MNVFEKVRTQNKPLLFLQFVFFGSILLYLGRSLFIPLSVALLLSFILFPFCNWLERKGFSRAMAIFTGISVFALISISFIALLVYQFLEFLKEWPELSGKLALLIQQIDERMASSWTKVFFEQGQGVVGSSANFISKNILPQLPHIIYDYAISMVLFVLIPIFVALILYYRERLMQFVYQIAPKSAYSKIRKIMPEVVHTYYNFIKGMGIVYLIVGILNSLGLYLLGIPNPIFFGFIASVLTFIPYVGITIGALLPIAVSWIKFDSLFYPIGVIIIFAIVQILEANVIFPLAVSNRLKINTLITLCVIVAGGIIWGAMGMILFLPYVAILKLVADQVDDMKPLATLLGTK